VHAEFSGQHLEAKFELQQVGVLPEHVVENPMWEQLLFPLQQLPVLPENGEQVQSDVVECIRAMTRIHTN